MAFIPSLTLFLGLSNFLSLDLKQQTPVVRFANRVQATRIEDYPYQVSLHVKNEHRCGGSIITENQVLTAAHCVLNIPLDELSVRVGSSIHFEGESIAVHAVTIHQTFNQDSLDCDVAFVTLGKYLTFGPSVKPIELADKRPTVGTLAVVTGWQITSRTPNSLKEVTVRLLEQESCKALYPDEIITNRMLCAEYAESSRTELCQGNSGAPLVDKSTGKQVGVVSWGAGCSRSALPTVYASVADLIHTRTKEV